MALNPSRDKRISKVNVARRCGFGTSGDAGQRLRTFVAQSEHIDAYKELRDNAPDNSGTFSLTKLSKMALKAVRDGDPMYCIAQPSSAKAGWKLGNHEVRYIVRVVMWCMQPPNGIWAWEPLGEEVFERPAMLLRYLKSEACEGRGKDILGAVEKGLEERRRRIVGSGAPVGAYNAAAPTASQQALAPNPSSATSDSPYPHPLSIPTSRTSMES
jgi:hypothetical protein